MDEKPYKIKEDPISRLIYCYKIRQGYNVDDRKWDAGEWARNAKSAKQLWLFFQDVELAAQCIKELTDYMSEKGFDWSLENVVKHKADYKRQITNYGKFYRLGYESKYEGKNG